jgi:hypothetical protein
MDHEKIFHLISLLFQTENVLLIEGRTDSANCYGCDCKRFEFQTPQKENTKHLPSCPVSICNGLNSPGSSRHPLWHYPHLICKGHKESCVHNGLGEQLLRLLQTCALSPQTLESSTCLAKVESSLVEMVASAAWWLTSPSESPSASSSVIARFQNQIPLRRSSCVLTPKTTW